MKVYTQVVCIQFHKGMLNATGVLGGEMTRGEMLPSLRSWTAGNSLSRLVS